MRWFFNVKGNLLIVTAFSFIFEHRIGSDLASEDGRSIGEGVGSDRLDTPEPPRCSSEKTISPHSISGDIGSSHKAPGTSISGSISISLPYIDKIRP